MEVFLFQAPPHKDHPYGLAPHMLDLFSVIFGASAALSLCGIAFTDKDRSYSKKSGAANRIGLLHLTYEHIHAAWKVISF